MARVWAESQHAGTELLMLLAIADFADDDGNAYPAVGTLATKCRMSARNANYLLLALQASGELQVLKGQGPYGTNRYRIVLEGVQQPSPPLKRTSPPTPPEAGFTPPLQPTSGGGCNGLPDPLKPASPKPSRTIKEPSRNHQKTRASKSHDLASMFPDLLMDVDSQVLRDWEDLRRQKRAPITRTALEAIAKEAALAKLTTGEALAMCCARGWQGFRADWVTGAGGAAGAGRRPITAYEQRAARMDEICGIRNYTAGIDGEGRVLDDAHLITEVPR